MSEMTWTKEWDGASIVIHGEDRQRVCLMATGSSPEQANLIAAAPELAEALEYSIATMEGIKDALNAQGVLIPVVLYTEIKRARAALAKARGE